MYFGVDKSRGDFPMMDVRNSVPIYPALAKGVLVAPLTNRAAAAVLRVWDLREIKFSYPHDLVVLPVKVHS
jgi:hypothetical protein